jgi:hypothetical protein
MTFKQSTIDEILQSEKEMVERGEERYGAYFKNAMDFDSLLGTGMISSIDRSRYIFAVFLAQVRKHLTLAIFSAVRLHHVQAMMNLRQALEAGASAAFAIAHTEPAEFANEKDDGTIDPSQKLSKKRYDWLTHNFPAGAEALKVMKDLINQFGAHSNIVSAYQNFRLDDVNRQFSTPFFDFEEADFVKTDLWQIANVELGLMDLFYGINEKFDVIKLQQDWGERFRTLAAENNRLRDEMMSLERFKKYSSSTAVIT